MGFKGCKEHFFSLDLVYQAKQTNVGSHCGKGKEKCISSVTAYYAISSKWVKRCIGIYFTLFHAKALLENVLRCIKLSSHWLLPRQEFSSQGENQSNRVTWCPERPESESWLVHSLWVIWRQINKISKVQNFQQSSGNNDGFHLTGLKSCKSEMRWYIYKPDVPRFSSLLGSHFLQ